MRPKVVGTTKSPLLKSDGRRRRHTRRLQNLACATFHFAAENHLLAGNLGSNLFQRRQVFQNIIPFKIEALFVAAPFQFTAQQDCQERAEYVAADGAVKPVEDRTSVKS